MRNGNEVASMKSEHRSKVKVVVALTERQSISSKQTSFTAGEHECTVDAPVHIYQPQGAYYLHCHYLISNIYIVESRLCPVVVVVS